VVLAALHALGDERFAEAAKRYGVDADTRPPWTRWNRGRTPISSG